MGTSISQKNKEANLKDLIERIMINRNIDADNEWRSKEEAKKEIVELSNVTGYKIGNSIKMGIDSEELIIFLSYNKGQLDKVDEEIKKQIEELIKKDVENVVNLVTITDNMKKKVRLQDHFDSEHKKRMKKEIDALKNINYFFIIDNIVEQNEIKITDINRYDIIEMPPIKNHTNWEACRDENKDTLKGYVTSVSLFQLVEIYNEIGDKLFEKNVRFGIEDQFDVDKAIKETLKKEPSKFWFKNNGITILEEKSDFKLDRSNEILLWDKKTNNKPTFTIINGAQTITAAAEFFYSEEFHLEQIENKGQGNETSVKDEKKRVQERLENAKKAQVILRIIHVANAEETNKDALEIGIALNRQKPIKIEDIAFTLSFIEKMCNFLDKESSISDKEYRFQLVKRGENKINGNGIDLVSFARARKACALQPGEARSKSSKVLLKIEMDKETEEFQFNDKQIFPKEWINEQDEEMFFNKYYKAINFTIKLANEYEKAMKSISDKIKNKDKYEIILNNGKWYFVALVVFILNIKNKDGYTNFKARREDIPNDITDVMISFAEHLNMYLNDKEIKSIDSNTFKNDRLFGELIENLKENANLKELEEKIISAFDKNEIVKKEKDREQNRIAVSTGLKQEKSEADKNEIVKKEKAREQNGTAVAIVLKKEKSEARNITKAFISTIEGILNKIDYDEMKLLKNCDSWLKKQNDYTQGYFRRNSIIKVKNKVYFVGTSSGTEVKLRQLKKLCESIEVPQGDIRWFSSEESDIFKW